MSSGPMLDMGVTVGGQQQPQFLLPQPPPAHHHPPIQRQSGLPLAVDIKSEPTCEAVEATLAKKKNYNSEDDSSHEQIVKSEFGQTARVSVPSGRTVLG
jgi:hypothetical protein